MRILHFSDVHIGVENYGRTDPETGLSTRLGDFLHTFDEVVSYALENGVDLVLFCGDAYKSRDPSQTHQREFARRLARLSSASIPTFLVLGNHDVPHVTSRATALDIFRTLDVNQVYTGHTLGTYRVQTAAGPVQIVALPWVRRGAFLAREDTQGLTPEEVNEAIQSKLTDAVRLQATSLERDIPAVFAGHVSLGEAEASSEQSMLLGREHVLLKSSVALPEFDYVALGHVHKHQVLGQAPPVVYSGSLQRIDFGEEDEDKGFCVVDLDTDRPPGLRVRDISFKTVDARRFLTITVSVPPGDPDPTATVVNAISTHYVSEAIVRIIVKLQEPDSRLLDSEIRRSLDGAHYVASISREVAQSARTRLGDSYSRALEPLEVLKLYLESRSVDTERAEVLIRHARGLMEQETD